MRNILAAVAIVIAIGVTLAAGIGIALLGFPTPVSAETTETIERWAPRFTYKACMSLQGFVPRMKEYGGELLSSGDISGGAAIISVMLFPDTSFGIFIYDPVSGYVCNISTGWFVQPGTPV